MQPAVTPAVFLNRNLPVSPANCRTLTNFLDFLPLFGENE